MSKWRRVVAFDVIMALLIVGLYFPAGLGLSPLSPDLLNAVASVVCAAIIGYELVKVNGRAITAARAAKRITAGDDSVPVDDIKRMLDEYQKTSVVGTYARNGKAQLESAERKRAVLYNNIGQKFQEGSLTWQKFVEVVDSATDAVAHNTLLLARRIQQFDVDDYNRNARNTITGLFNRGTVPEDLRQEKRAVYELSLNDMQGIIAANERLLIELDRFSHEMGQLETSANAEANNRLLEEVNTLVDETKYYR